MNKIFIPNIKIEIDGKRIAYENVIMFNTYEAQKFYGSMVIELTEDNKEIFKNKPYETFNIFVETDYFKVWYRGLIDWNLSSPDIFDNLDIWTVNLRLDVSEIKREIKSEVKNNEEEIEKVAKLIEDFQTNYGFFRIGDIDKKPSNSFAFPLSHCIKEDYYTYSKNLLNDKNTYEDIKNILDILSMTYMYNSDYEEPVYIDLRKVLKEFRIIRTQRRVI